jgi:hypothetical protein
MVCQDCSLTPRQLAAAAAAATAAGVVCLVVLAAVTTAPFLSYVGSSNSRPKARSPQQRCNQLCSTQVLLHLTPLPLLLSLSQQQQQQHHLLQRLLRAPAR